MEGIIARAHREVTARNRHLQVGMKRIVGRGHAERSARDADIGFRLHRVVARIGRKDAARNAHEALRRFGVLVRLDAVAACRQIKGPVSNLHAIATAQAILDRCHVQGTACDDQVVLRADAVAIIRRHVEGPRAVNGEVAAAKERRVRLIGVVFERVSGTVGKRVLRAIGQGHKAFIDVLRIDRGTVLVVDSCPRKYQLNLRVIGRVDHDLPRRKLT